MKKALVAYFSASGVTEQVAERLANWVKSLGIYCESLHCKPGARLCN